MSSAELSPGPTQNTQAFLDLNDFLRLSAVLNYQLSAKNIDWLGILYIILADKQISDRDKKVLLQAFDYLSDVYGKRKRRLGPFSVLHPLRATALFSRLADKPSLVDLLTILLHDNFEDIKPKNFLGINWQKMDTKFKTVLINLDQIENWYLRERLDWLTKEPNESYYTYVGRLLEKSRQTPEVVCVKLADRLDNTLDMRIELEDPLREVNFFEIVFQMMFSNTYNGYQPKLPHPAPAVLNGAQRLFQLFKNTLLMSLVRQNKSAIHSETAQRIFQYLARASMREAERIALHIFGYHHKSIKEIRRLMIETMAYVQQGGIDSITPPGSGARLDGLFMSIFDSASKKIRHRKLSALYQDKSLMIEASIAFIVIFLSFQNNPHFYVKGISEQGVKPLMVKQVFPMK